MSSDHLVTSYDEELEQLDTTVAEIGRLAIDQIETALRVLAGADRGLTRTAQEQERKIDGLERDVDQFTLRLLALRQPLADDLRGIVAALRVSIDLERVAECAAGVARRAASLDPKVAPFAVQELEWMGQRLVRTLHQTIDAYQRRDAPLAAKLWHEDDEIDRLYLRVLHALRQRMVEDPETVEPCTHLLFISKNLERIGDHLTNVCEHIQYMVGACSLTRGALSPAATVIHLPGAGAR